MKTFKKVVSLFAALLLVAVMAVGAFSVSAAKDQYKDYEEFKGTIAVLSNCDQNDNSQKGKIDPFETSDKAEEIEGTATTAGKASGNISYSTDHYLQGSSAIKVHVTKDLTTTATPPCSRTRFVIRQIEGVKVTDANTTYLSFYMYCDSAEDLKAINWGASAVEISEQSDVKGKEFEFSFTAIQQYNTNGNFVNGWNKIQIPLVKGGKYAMDIKMFRFFIYSSGSKDVDIYIDNITLEKGEPFEVESKPAIVGVPDASSKASSTEETSSTESVDVSSDIAEVTSTVVEDTTVSETASVESETDSESGGIPVLVWVIIAVAVVAIAGTAVYFLVIKKK